MTLNPSFFILKNGTEKRAMRSDRSSFGISFQCLVFVPVSRRVSWYFVPVFRFGICVSSVRAFRFGRFGICASSVRAFRFGISFRYLR